MGDYAVLLDNPKFPDNVGAILRTTSVFGGQQLIVVGERCQKTVANLSRLPREERMRQYAGTELAWHERLDRPVTTLYQRMGFIPVCVEFDESAEPLPDFVHPAHALYVFGPEDGSVSDGFRRACHRFVKIPTEHCLNLSTATAIVLYDRMAKGL